MPRKLWFYALNVFPQLAFTDDVRSGAFGCKLVERLSPLEGISPLLRRDPGAPESLFWAS